MTAVRSRRRIARDATVAFAVTLVAACSSSSTNTNGGDAGGDVGTTTTDAHTAAHDSGHKADTGTTSADAGVDATTPDATSQPDAHTAGDTGTVDTGTVDTGTTTHDAGVDANHGDANHGDAGHDAAAPSCTDGIKNGDETGVDCGGGGACKACPDTTACKVTTDCLSNVCTNDVCAAPACGPTCVDGNVCGANADCGSGVCTAGKCAAPACGPTCALGAACGSNGDCASFACTGSVCAAPVDCAAILAANPTAASGAYTIQPAGAAAAFSTYCDMVTDGGGWTQIRTLPLPISALPWQQATDVPYANIIPTDPSTATREMVMLSLDATYGWASWDLAGTAPEAWTTLGFDADMQEILTNGRFGINTTTGADITPLRISMWPDCYSPTAATNTYSYLDVVNAGSLCYGTFSLYADTETILAANRWAANGAIDVGLDNQPTGNPNWTFAQTAGNFTTRTLSWFVR